MAERAGNMTTLLPGAVKVEWTGLLNTDSGAPAALGVYGDATVQLKGTLGAGGTAILEGSLDGGTTWGPLTDPGGGAISLTAVGAIETVLQYCDVIRPRVTAGDGSTNLTVIVVARKPI